ncbi:hypothetical protein FB565_000895 [Actinoplanes lutulentus]|uniref:Uncharacterized protein n=1 Tax=Actinoplanes lutulentus TaxID=1287878 RepID=A0A327ZLT9_9ACTN|nr:hypothetical protein [Actinoplanes lutulentus]MBB2941191.1 hypothetical protein [Actinoplanes lutulentus]RAK43500.1 hypothetical protein B0I29_101630 [Actinoplanes lutulentus]
MDIWAVKSDDQRESWRMVPLVSIGPLRFGMSLSEVTALLVETPLVATTLIGGEVQDAHTSERTTLYFKRGHLYGVALDARIGPQVEFEGIRLTGRIPSEVEDQVWRYSQKHNVELRYAPTADPHLPSLGLILRVQRAGDGLLSRPVFIASDNSDAWHAVPDKEWNVYL